MLLPTAEWGRLATDGLVVRWDAGVASRLADHAWLRTMVAATWPQLSRSAPPPRLLTAQPADRWPRILAAWSQLQPWRSVPPLWAAARASQPRQRPLTAPDRVRIARWWRTCCAPIAYAIDSDCTVPLGPSATAPLTRRLCPDPGLRLSFSIAPQPLSRSLRITLLTNIISCFSQAAWTKTRGTQTCPFSGTRVFKNGHGADPPTFANAEMLIRGVT